jgi:uncharacterized membrane protein
MKHCDTRRLTLAAVVGALYAATTMFISAFGIAYLPIQFRVSEALCVLPYFFPEAAPGLFVGCLVANLLSPYGALDIVFGSLATLIAAVCTAKVRRKWLAPLPPVIANGLIVGALIAFEEVGFGDGFAAAFAFNCATIAAGEAVSCYVLGGILLKTLPNISYFRKRIPEEKR